MFVEDSGSNIQIWERRKKPKQLTDIILRKKKQCQWTYRQEFKCFILSDNSMDIWDKEKAYLIAKNKKFKVWKTWSVKMQEEN